MAKQLYLKLFTFTFFNLNAIRKHAFVCLQGREALFIEHISFMRWIQCAED